MRVRVVVAAGLVLLVARADAARRRFGWILDADVLPERGVELEWWLSERTGYARSLAALTVAGVVGLTDTLELAAPFDVVWRQETGRTELEDYGADLRWRLAPADANKAGPLVPLVRAGVRRLIQTDAARFEGDLVLAIDATRALRVVLDAGLYGETANGEIEATFGAGASYAATEDVHLGVEAYGEKTMKSAGAEDDFWISAGPAVSLTYGRFWLTASLPIGLSSDAPTLLPRIVWAMAF